jgi:hypothetical protein
MVLNKIYERKQEPYQYQNNLIESIDLADFVKELYDTQNKNQT